MNTENKIMIDQLREVLEGVSLETLDDTYEPSTGEFGLTLRFAGDIQLRFEASGGGLTVRMRRPADWIDVV